MVQCLIAFEQKGVPELSDGQLVRLGADAAAVHEEMRAAGVQVFTGGRSRPTTSARQAGDRTG